MKNNTDRVLVVLCEFFVLISTIMVFVNFSFSWLWILLLFWTIGLGVWSWKGFKKIEVGWKGQLLYLGERQSYTFGEGWRWAPFPFSIKTADCRQTVIKLNSLKVITKDNIEVEIEGSIFRQISELDKYFGVEESGIKEGLDDIWDETIRMNVRDMNLNEVLKSHDTLGKEMIKAIGARASADWGIEILRIVIAGIKPDLKVMEDLELGKREKLQRNGQVVEITHFEKMVKKLMRPIPKGAGLTREQAIEQVQLALGKASKTIDAKTISLDAITAGIVAKVLGGDLSWR